MSNKKYRKIFFAVLFLTIALAIFLLFFKKTDGGNANGLVRKVSEILKENKSDRNEEKKSLEKKSVSILFAGDLMLDRYIRSVVYSKGGDFVFAGVKETMAECDAVVANLEGPITKNRSISVGTELGEKNNYKFTFDPDSIRLLKDYNIKAVSIGNNHMLDFGLDGALETEKSLQEGGIVYFGRFNGNTSTPAYLLDVQGVKVGLVNYNQFSKNCEIGALDDIQDLRAKADIVVVYTHWGREYQTLADEKERSLARSFIDAGADLVIGSHPHVIQPIEEYKGKRIYYSLGNFVFDQYFSEETKKGLLVRATIIPGQSSISFEDMSIRLSTNGKTEIVR